jgi:DNA-binding MarR family transcriptional regulator
MAKHGKKSPDRKRSKPSIDPAENPPLVGSLDEALSYVLKHAASTLRSAMADALRPLDVSVAQHACLELLGRSPGLSSSDLARGAFVSRQSMNLVLRGLQDRGLVTRPEIAPQGRALPTRLTALGRERLNAANAVARTVEKRMLTAVPEKRRARFRADLAACTAAFAAAE